MQGAAANAARGGNSPRRGGTGSALSRARPGSPSLINGEPSAEGIWEQEARWDARRLGFEESLCTSAVDTSPRPRVLPFTPPALIPSSARFKFTAIRGF